MSEGELTIHVNRGEIAGELNDPHDVVSVVEATARAEAVEAGEISVTFCSMTAIAELNQKYLNQEGSTDVIAFNLGEGNRPLGDVYICPEIARRSAEEYGVSPREELLRLVVHGVLHVLGYDHPEGPERADSEMFRRQEAVLEGLKSPGR